MTANGESTPVIGAGSIVLTPNLSLHNCLLAPAPSNHLLSVSQITEELDCGILMFPMFCLLQDIRTQAIIGRDTKRKGLYYVDNVASGHVHQVQSHNGNNHKNIWLWHRRLGHASYGYLKKLFPSLFDDILDPSSSLKCNVCILAKSHQTSYPVNLNKRTKPFELIHSHVWGPAPITSQSGIRWFITFIDDYTRMTWLYTMRHKSDVRNIFLIFYRMVCTQFSLPVKIIRSDNCGEYLNSELLSFFQNNGILHETTCPRTPQQNGVVECKNRHILETTRALLIGAHVPQHY
jgi:transposase InsO family protein